MTTKQEIYWTEANGDPADNSAALAELLVRASKGEIADGSIAELTRIAGDHITTLANRLSNARELIRKTAAYLSEGKAIEQDSAAHLDFLAVAEKQEGN